ncbi:TonB-linked SusC/RagA family outer membrane protein [Marinilabilia salmonicolor]|jgi:TonB-linked SusC/RagA family outer membrane protein|uniref:SusC/RagA family TonB-linked outer membrane protein n=1 Tax=Marinilabilia salmonicolor TaxID=989 RepID=UPI000D054B7D|nr:SusC/RagA family TonB-linked outer membrane protein [Marinilabilia salmonicolor]PRY99874.1 TonB-linked SusC/RagA family outer membrane protein [Marinilabilia salmonicolor]
MKASFLVILVLSIFSLSVFGQETVVRGKVVDEKGGPLPGASVVARGTSAGTITDMNGNFELNVPETAEVLTFSFIGFESVELPLDGRAFYDVVLQPTVTDLDEVVVTALGIKRDAKALGYAVQQVGGEEMEDASGIAPLSGLSGKVSGLNISGSGNGPAGSTKVLIRGVNSLTGSNDPLYVVDGVPMDNSGGASGTEWGGFDYGNAANNINPSDIESISVLKGGAAAALYGARGQNGVIMITTKSGSEQKGLGISVSSSYEIANPLIKPDFQNNYSQGAAGKFEPLSYRSWGAKMNGQSVTNFLNEEQQLRSPAEHPYDTFFQTGTTLTNTVSLNNRNEKNGVYFSASQMNNENLQPGSTYDKSSFTIRFDTKPAEYFKLDTKLNYVYTEAENRPNLAGSPDNPVYLMTVMPRSVGFDQLKPYRTVDGYPVVWTSQYQRNNDGTIAWRNAPPEFASSPLLQNPYWAINENRNEDSRNRLIGFAEASIDFKELLNLGFKLEFKGKAGVDYYSENRKRITAHNTYYKADGKATINDTRLEVREENYDFLLNAEQSWGQFRANGSLGGNLMRNTYKSVASTSESGLINEVGPYVIQNFMNPVTSEGISEREIQSLYGLFSFDYASKLFLDVTLRNDWTSVLSPENWSYLYPSVSASWIASESLTMPDWVNFLKIRGSWASVGNGGQYASYRYMNYGTNANQFHGLPYGFVPGVRPEKDLKSELTISKEVGINASLFDNRLSIDAAVYQSGTEDQIFKAPMAPSSGYNSGIVNAGYINNSGVELSISGDVIKNADLTWNLGANITRQWSEVEELDDEVDVLNLGGAGGVIIAARKGDPVGIMLGSAYARDESGRIMLDDENLPMLKTTEEGAIDTEQTIGNAYPDWLLGLKSGLRYKGAFLNFQIDSKLGHDIFSMTNMRGGLYGTLAFTEEGRDEWEKAKEISQVTGVAPNDGYMVEGVKNGVEGEYPVDPQKYWDRLARINEAFVDDASFIRLKQVSVGYQFSNDFLKTSPFKKLSVSLVANNLAYLMRNTRNISPESSFGTGNAVGYEMFSFPETRTVALNLKLDF